MDYYERKKRFRESFRKKFSMDPWTGSYKLTAHGCYQRHNLKRDEMNMTRMESEKKENGSNLTSWKENKMMNDLSRFTKMGYEIKGDEMVEEFVRRIKIKLYECPECDGELKLLVDHETLECPKCGLTEYLEDYE